MFLNIFKQKKYECSDDFYNNLEFLLNNHNETSHGGRKLNLLGVKINNDPYQEIELEKEIETTKNGKNCNYIIIKHRSEYYTGEGLKYGYINTYRVFDDNTSDSFIPEELLLYLNNKSLLLRNEIEKKLSILENPIYKMAKEILERIGNEYDHPDDHLGRGGYTEIFYQYDYLYISSRGNTYIKYKGNPVFNTKYGIIRHGEWEKLLEEIYHNLNSLEEEKINKNAMFNLKKQRCIELMKILSKDTLGYDSDGYYTWDSKLKLFNTNPILKFHYNTSKSKICYIEEIDVLLEITSKKDYSSYYNLTEDIPEAHYYYKIYTNNELCCEFHGFEGSKILPNYDVYLIGTWEEKLINYIQQKELEEKEKNQKIEEIEVLDSIRRLKRTL